MPRLYIDNTPENRQNNQIKKLNFMKTIIRNCAWLLSFVFLATVISGCNDAGPSVSGSIEINEETIRIEGEEFTVDVPLTADNVFVVDFTGGGGTAIVRSSPLIVSGLYIPQQTVTLSGGELRLPIHGVPTTSGEFTMRVEIITGYDGWDRYTVPHLVSVEFTVGQPGEGEDFDGGQGFRTNPWLISTAAQLDLIRDYPNRHFRLTNDVNLATLTDEWVPIPSFSGSIDGAGYSINGLTHAALTATNPANVAEGAGGFIHRLEAPGAIRNVAFRNISINTAIRVGGIVAIQAGGAIDNIVVTGAINSTNATDRWTGGITGQISAGSLTNSFVNMNITTGSGMTGGAVGMQAPPSALILIANVTTQGSITITRSMPTARVAGILGRAEAPGLNQTPIHVRNNWSSMNIGAGAGFNIEGAGGIFGACNNPGGMYIFENKFSGTLTNVRQAGGISGAGPRVSNNLVAGPSASDPLIFTVAGTPGSGAIGAIAGAGKFFLRNNIARNVTITGPSQAARALAGVASHFEQNCVTEYNVVQNITLDGTFANGIAGNNPVGIGVTRRNFRNNVTFPSGITPGDDADGRDGAVEATLNQAFYESLGFDFTNVWIMENGVPMLRNVGYQGDIPTN